MARNGALAPCVIYKERKVDKFPNDEEIVTVTGTYIGMPSLLASSKNTLPTLAQEVSVNKTILVLYYLFHSNVGAL